MNRIYLHFTKHKLTGKLQVYFTQIMVIYTSLFCITNPRVCFPYTKSVSQSVIHTHPHTSIRLCLFSASVNKSHKDKHNVLWYCEHLCINTLQSPLWKFGSFLLKLDTILPSLYTPKLHFIICGDINVKLPK